MKIEGQKNGGGTKRLGLRQHEINQLVRAVAAGKSWPEAKALFPNVADKALEGWREYVHAEAARADPGPVQDGIGEVAALKHQIEDFQKKLDARADRIVELEAKLAERNRRIVELESEPDRIRELEVSLKQSEEHVDRLQDLLAAKEKEINELLLGDGPKAATPAKPNKR